ncbi:Rhamnan synthesis protein F [Agrobacterium fabrum]|uniref:Rhamnan synthesis protein F n=2 Tax=Agrobacterium fabrum TaxID=1176649 RepID=A0A7Z7BQG1_9HYPH|nr:Rhamnan synthesis protein F [Agrobacterium fabrum]
MPRVKKISLEPGYYKLSFQNIDPEVRAIELIDGDDLERCCRLDLSQGRLRYALHLQKPVDAGKVRFVTNRPGERETNIDFIPTSQMFFSIKKTWAAIQRHRLQNFGPGEKLLCLSGGKDVVEAAAFANVEYRALRLYGLDDLSKENNGWDWLDEGWPLVDHSEKAVSPLPLRACVYVHLHYMETWPEIKAALLQNTVEMDVVISVTAHDSNFRENVLTTFPNARIIHMENRGRDVGPFMELLKQGIFKNYDAVCKIHGKLSRKNGKETISGHRIRRYTLACLLANGAGDHVLKSFSEYPEIGLLGPRNLSLPLQGKPVSQYIKNELSRMRQVFQRADVTFDPQDAQFFVGTMFWFRPAAFKLLERTNIGLNDFQPENGAKKGTLQHGLERAFSSLTKQAGYKVAAKQPTPRNGTISMVEFI